MKIGICGGTFDPFHRGHLEPVLAARSVMEWDRLLYVVAYRQPFKPDQQVASGYHRFTMAVLATESIETAYVSTQELDRGQISYTVETLELLRAEHPQATLDWIIGDDNLAQLGEWKRIDRIFELANFAVLTRYGSQIADGRSQEEPNAPAIRDPRSAIPERFRARVIDPAERRTCGHIAFAGNSTVPVSSTDIRRKIRAGESIDRLVDPRVSHYIEHNRLYREAQT